MAFQFFKGFHEAFRGLAYLLREERHFRFQVAVAVILAIMMIVLPLTYTEAGFIIIAITLVLVSEAANTMVERMMDSITTERNKWIGEIKDIMASSVLLSSMGAFCMGIITLIHYGMRVSNSSGIGDLDRLIFFWLNGFSGRAVWSDWTITFVGSTLAVILVIFFILAVGLARISGRKKIYWLMTGTAAGIVARYGVVELIRFLAPRPRPFVANNVYQLIAEQGSSLPSGHASFFFALSTIAFLFNKKLGICFFAASTAIGIGRVMAGVHYPSDIMTGIIVGIITAWIVYSILLVAVLRYSK